MGELIGSLVSGGNKMAEFKLVLSRKDGKSFQKVVKDNEAQALLKKRIKEKISGKDIGMEGYELEITGGSDKCGFPMRKGILQIRKRIMVKGEGVGFSGKGRNKKKQDGLRRKRTVCGEMIDKDIVQINLKILKEGQDKLGEEEPKEAEKSEETPKEEKVEEKEAVTEKPKEEAKPAEKEAEEAPKEKDKPKEETKEEPEPKKEG